MRRLLPGLAVAALALAAVPAARADVTLQYFTLPAELKGTGNGLEVAPNGTVYFGSGDGFEQTPPIGRLNPAQAVPGTANGITWVNTPDAPGCCAAIFRDMSWSALDGRLYWTRSDSTVGTLVADTVTAVQIPSAPWGIAAAPDGGAWLTEYGSSNVSPAYTGNRLARIDAGLGLQEHPNLALQTGSFDGTRYDAKPKGIAVAPGGKPWFVQAEAGNPGYRIATTGGALGYTEYRPCPTAALCSGVSSGTALTDVAVAGDGTVWYTNELKKTIGRFVPATADYAEFRLADIDAALASGTPRALRTAPDGAIWAAVDGGFSSPGANAILRIAPAASPTVTTYKLGAASRPFEVAPAPNGDVYFTGSPGAGGGPLGRIADAGGPGPDPTPTPTPTPEATPTPQPGINITVNNPVTVNVTTVVAINIGVAQVTDPTVRGNAISANQICVGPPTDRCSLVYLLDTREYITGFPGSGGRIAAAKKTTIGKASVTLKGGQKKKITLKLNAKGRKLLKKQGFKATLTVTQAVNGGKKKTILKKTVRFKR
jgi:streptogramin lyase